MSIHQTKDGRWFVAYRVKNNRQIKRAYFGRGADAKVNALKWEAEWLAQSKRGNVEPGQEITFGELAQRYLNARPLTPRTRESMIYTLNLHIIPHLAPIFVSRLNMSHLSEIDDRLSALGRSLGTRNRLRSYCKAICQWGVNNDLVEINPFARFHPETKKEGKAPDLLTEDELRAIYQAAPPHLQWAIEVMMNTGVRPGVTELFAIKMSDIDLENNGLWIARHKTREKNKSLLPLLPGFMEKIKQLKKSEPSREYVVEFRGKPVGTLKTAWAATLKKAGITRRLRLYDLRHWYATKLLSGGADLKAASELLGHASPNTTLSTYYHLLERQKRTALDHLTIPDLSTTNQPPNPTKK